MYNHDMECQVNVGSDGGTCIESEYKGRSWRGWTDGITTWKPFRIPINANSNPSFEDTPITWDFDSHVEGIGMTGWDWKAKLSRWVAFDLDAILGHKATHQKKLSPEELDKARLAAMEIPWITVRKSTSGKGLHLYAMLDPVITDTHTEHAALARSVLGSLSAITGYDFSTKVDMCGGNMWVWHRKMLGTDGLSIIKEATELFDPAPNWEEHIPVITGIRKKTRPGFIDDSNQSAEITFDDLISQTTKVSLDDDHRRLIDWLGPRAYWEPDHNILVTHTYALKEAHESLGLRGLYQTISTGRVAGDYNCFLHALSFGAWSVRRYTLGVSEAKTWSQDGQGWTQCYYNRDATLDVVAKVNDGVEDEKGAFKFIQAASAEQAAISLGANLQLPSWIQNRPAKVRPHKDGRRIIVEVDKQDNDPAMPEWLPDKGKWKRIFTTRIPPLVPPELRNYDHIVRHLILSGVDFGWMLRSPEGQWIKEPLQHVSCALESFGLPPKDAKNVVGTSVIKHWTLVNEPFREEYLGDRIWNLNAPKLAAVPSTDIDNLRYPTWLKILNRCGQGLNESIKLNPWAIANGIRNGADYLKCWIASMIKEPFEPLPYLFFYGESNIGKSTFHEALTLLMTRGWMDAGIAITNTSGFNAELMNAVMCFIEETNLNQNKVAYNRIKEWVTAREILFHEKKRTPILIKNTTHWIQTANDAAACPIFPGDTRITMIEVAPMGLGEMIPKKDLFPLLQKEIPDFLAALIQLELPPSGDRLNIPVIDTESKRRVESSNRSILDTFIAEECYYCPGSIVLFAEFYDKFIEWLEPSYQPEWTKIKTGRAIPSTFAYGRRLKDNAKAIGNISFLPPSEEQLTGPKYYVINDFLKLEKT